MIGLPVEFTDWKLKDIQIVASPVIPPMIKGYELKEGPFDDDEIYKTLVDAHELYTLFCRQINILWPPN